MQHVLAKHAYVHVILIYFEKFDYFIFIVALDAPNIFRVHFFQRRHNAETSANKLEPLFSSKSRA